MIKLNYIDLGAHKGQEMGLVLDHYENYKDKFDLSIYAVEAYTPFFLKLKERYVDKKMGFSNNQSKVFYYIVRSTNFSRPDLSIYISCSK